VLERGVPIRAISRGIAVLSAVNRDGPISMMRISKSAEIPYPTACRIVQTLLHEGFIEREPSRKRYRVTSLVQTLSTGFQAEDHLVAIARPHIEELCRKLSWPISLATRVGTRMMVRDSTHGMTSLTFSNYYPGFTLPIADCATGKAYLAFCSDTEREAVIEGWNATDNETSRAGLLMLREEDVLDDIRAKGYALQSRNFHTSDPGKTSSIAVPLRAGDGHVVGALALIYFFSAMKSKEAVDRFLPGLMEAADAIHTDLKNSELSVS
jgi:IclR family mhp operon transcriptional activator